MGRSVTPNLKYAIYLFLLMNQENTSANNTTEDKEDESSRLSVQDQGLQSG